MSTEKTVNKPFTLSEKSKENMRGVNPILQILAERAIVLSEVDFGILENGGFRTAEQQNDLYFRGASQLDGYNRISFHQLGNALDLVPYINKKYTWKDIEAFKKINEAVMKAWNAMDVRGVKLVWGGHWVKFPDYAHYEIKKAK